MDVLSDVITALRTGTPRSAHVTWHGQWHQHYPEVPGAIGFHVILDGTCQLQSPTQLTLSTGDILFLPHSPAHTLAALTPEQSLPPAAYLAPPSTTAPQATFSNTAPGSQAPAPPETTDPSLANPITTLGRPMFTPPETTGASLFAPAPPQLASANSGRTTKSPPLPKPLPTHIRATTPGTGPITTITLCGAYELTPTQTHPLLPTLPPAIHLPAHTQSPELTAARTLLAHELTTPTQGTTALIPALLDTLLLYLLRATLTATTTPGWSAALRDPATTAALQAIHQNPAHPWTVAKLAAEAGLSRAPFARRFTTLVGQPPLTYLTWWRMTTAARLLRTGTDPLTSIAARVGYTSEFAFATAFKRAFGTPPGRYRRG